MLIFSLIWSTANRDRQIRNHDMSLVTLQEMYGEQRSIVTLSMAFSKMADVILMEILIERRAQQLLR